jgi:ribose/xylose/arabinose/galactoside ABC-type transport system permease subunit
MEIKQVLNPLSGGKMSDESFISLFMVGVLVVLFGIASIFVPNFFQPQNMINLITNNWYLIILGIGVTFLLTTGNLDMSVGGIVALTGVLSVYFCQEANVSQNNAGEWAWAALRSRHRSGPVVRDVWARSTPSSSPA